jgi:hypothetical protein
MEFVTCHIGTHAVIRNDISYRAGKWVGGKGGKQKYPSSYKMPRVEEAERTFVFQGLV